MILFICNTSFQIFNAINMKQQMFLNEHVDLIISNHAELEHIMLNLKKTKLFNNIWRTESLFLARKFFFFDDLKKYDALENPESYVEECLKIDYLKYSNIFTANVDGYINLIFQLHLKHRTECKFNYFEDGWSTYTNDWSNFACSPYEKYYNEMLGIKIFQKEISDIYIYEPELGCFPEKFKYKPIPKIKKTNVLLKNIINCAFGYKENQEYHKSAIFFEEAFEQDGYKNNDIELISEVVYKVGEDELLLKRHPRLTENRFKNLKISTNNDCSIPWEVHFLNNDFSKKVLFTITSGAVLTPRLIFNEVSYIVYLRDLLQGTVSKFYKTKEFKKFISNYRMKFPNELYIPKTRNGINVCIKLINSEMQSREWFYNNN